MTKSEYLVNRNGWFHFRIRIPKDLQEWFKKKHIYRSLKTKSIGKAIKLADGIAAEFLQLFKRIRMGIYSEAEIKELVKSYLIGKLQENEDYRQGPHREAYRGAQRALTVKQLEDLRNDSIQKIGAWDEEAYRQTAERFISQYGLKDIPNERYPVLGREVLKANAEIIGIEIHRKNGNYSNQFDSYIENLITPDTGEITPLESMSLTTNRISSLIEEYVTEHTVGGRWVEKTKAENMAALDLLLVIVGDVDIRTINHTLMFDLRKKVRALPPNRSKDKRYRGKTIDEVLALKPVKQLSITRVNNILVKISSFFSWAVDHDYVVKNPASKLTYPVSKSVKEERDVYTVDALNTMLLKLAELKKLYPQPEKAWVPVIALYSGMRLNEICQLYREDVQEYDGILCFNINGEEDKRLKTKNSARLVPVHVTLLDLGFDQYLARVDKDSADRIWPSLTNARDGYSQNFSKWFGRFNRKEVTEDKRKVFHSLRHTFITHIQNSAEASILKSLVGHVQEGETFGRYGKGYQTAVLSEAINTLDFPELDLDPIRNILGNTWSLNYD